MSGILGGLARQLRAAVLQALTTPPPAVRTAAPAPAAAVPWRDASGRVVCPPGGTGRAALVAARDVAAGATRAEAAARHRIGPGTISRGTRVTRHPDLAALVTAGEMSLHAAYCLARLREERPELAARAEARKSAHTRAIAASEGLLRLQAAKRPHPS